MTNRLPTARELRQQLDDIHDALAKRIVPIHTENLIIINMWDRPCMHLVCRILPSERIIYINKQLRKEYPVLKKGEGWASLKDYGFIYDANKNKYIKKHKSNVKYSDGKIREWQGLTEFSYDEILNSSKYGD